MLPPSLPILLDFNLTGISEQRCELPAGIGLPHLLPLANPLRRRLSDVNDWLRINLPMIFSKELPGWRIAFDQPSVLHVSFLEFENVEREESNHCAALYLLPVSTAEAFFEVGSAKDVKGVGNIAHSRAQNSATKTNQRTPRI
jgi:hypothetical protein